MSLIPLRCIEYNEIRKVNVAEENGKEFRLTNNSGFKIQKVKCDGCLAQKTGEKRCDYLMIVDGEKLKCIFFIELKGGALKDALDQLNNTIDYLKHEFKSFSMQARIVGSKDIPNFIGLPEYKSLVKKVGLNSIKRATNKVLNETI